MLSVALEGYGTVHESILTHLEQEKWDAADGNFVAWPTNLLANLLWIATPKAIVHSPTLTMLLAPLFRDTKYR